MSGKSLEVLEISVLPLTSTISSPTTIFKPLVPLVPVVPVLAPVVRLPIAPAPIAPTVLIKSVTPMIINPLTPPITTTTVVKAPVALTPTPIIVQPKPATTVAPVRLPAPAPTKPMIFLPQFSVTNVVKRVTPIKPVAPLVVEDQAMRVVAPTPAPGTSLKKVALVLGGVGALFVGWRMLRKPKKGLSGVKTHKGKRKKMTQAQAKRWLIDNDPEGASFWRSRPRGTNFIKAYRDNIRDFGEVAPRRARKQVKRLASKRSFDKRSFRTKKVKKGVRIIVGCPKGKWQSRKKRCKVGMRAYEIIKTR